LSKAVAKNLATKNSGLIFPVAPVYKSRVSSATPVYLTGILEHISVEIINICSRKADILGKNTIDSRILKISLGEDEEFELMKALCFNIVDGGGVIPFVSSSSVPSI
jgi:hypothetical protein